MVENYSAVGDKLMKLVIYTQSHAFHWKFLIQIWKHGIKKHRKGRKLKGYCVQPHSPV